MQIEKIKKLKQIKGIRNARSSVSKGICNCTTIGTQLTLQALTDPANQLLLRCRPSTLHLLACSSAALKQLIC